MHGINLGGWLSQCDHSKERYDTFITEADFRTIAEWGLDHVRIPVDYDLVEEKDGTRKESGFVYLQNAIDWCGKYGLNMVLDLHKACGFSFDDGEKESGFFDDPALQERFYRLWEEFALRYGNYSDRLSFELLNEVTDESYSESWNAVSAECIRRIRKIAPEIHILIGGCLNNHIRMLQKLDPPADENIVYNFHLYEPLIFTHQGAYWIPTMDTSFRMPFHSTYGDYAAYSEQQLSPTQIDPFEFESSRMFGAEYFERYLADAVRLAASRNTALYCGEYGVIDLVGPEDTLDWYRTVCGCFDRYGIGRAAWTYRKMDFGLSDARADSIRDELLRVI